MRWPWVSRELYDYQSAIIDGLLEVNSATRRDAQAQYDRLFDEYARLRERGAAPAAKARTIEPDPETKYIRGLEAEHRAQLVRQFMAVDKVDEPTAKVAAEQAMQGFLGGQ